MAGGNRNDSRLRMDMEDTEQRREVGLWPMWLGIVLSIPTFFIHLYEDQSGTVAFIYTSYTFLFWFSLFCLIRIIVVKLQGKDTKTLGEVIFSDWVYPISGLSSTFWFSGVFELGFPILLCLFVGMGSMAASLGILYGLRAIFRRILRVGGAIERSNLFLIVLLVFIFGLIASAVIFVNPEKPTVAQVAATPTEKPTQKPTPRPTKRPTATTRPLMLTVTAIVARDKSAGVVDGCYLWSKITLADKGKTMCVYGTADSTYHREGTFYVTFGNDRNDFYFVSYGDFWYEGMKGNCVMAEGKVEQIGSAPVIVVPENKFYHCD